MIREEVKVEYVTTRYGTRYLRMGPSEWYSIEKKFDGSVQMQQIVTPRLLEMDYNKLVRLEGEKDG